MSELNDNTKLNIIEASREFGSRTVQSIHAAIKKGRLKAHRTGRCWWIYKKDLLEYHQSKYSRDCSTFNGSPLYDNEKGEYSCQQMSKLLGITVQLIYYLLRQGHIKGARKGGVWVLDRDQAIEGLQEWKRNYKKKTLWDTEDQLEFAMGDK